VPLGTMFYSAPFPVWQTIQPFAQLGGANNVFRRMGNTLNNLVFQKYLQEMTDADWSANWRPFNLYGKLGGRSWFNVSLFKPQAILSIKVCAEIPKHKSGGPSGVCKGFTAFHIPVSMDVSLFVRKICSGSHTVN